MDPEVQSGLHVVIFVVDPEIRKSSHMEPFGRRKFGKFVLMLIIKPPNLLGILYHSDGHVDVTFLFV